MKFGLGNLGINGCLAVSTKGLKSRLNGKEQLWKPRDIDELCVEKGTVQIRHVDAEDGWFSSTGVIEFTWHEWSNGRLFLHLMNESLGVEPE